jgi:hypothetical protein
MDFLPFCSFIKDRHAIYERRTAGKPKPWTKDPILQQYRFCNVFRELDTVTIWIRKHWREPMCNDPDVWFAMVVARIVNWPDTLKLIDDPVPWNAKRFVQVIRNQQSASKKAYTGAYIVSTNGSTQEKSQYLADRVLTPMWQARKQLRPVASDTLSSYFDRLHEFDGMGGFMAGQVVADLKYLAPLRSASDWSTWARSGPGSRRGLARVVGRWPDARWNEKEWHETLMELMARCSKPLRGMPEIHAQDLQNCLCEYDKYCRVKLGEGRPRSRYNGGGQQEFDI